MKMFYKIYQHFVKYELVISRFHNFRGKYISVKVNNRIIAQITFKIENLRDLKKIEQ